MDTRQCVSPGGAGAEAACGIRRTSSSSEIPWHGEVAPCSPDPRDPAYEEKLLHGPWSPTKRAPKRRLRARTVDRNKLPVSRQKLLRRQ